MKRPRSSPEHDEQVKLVRILTLSKIRHFAVPNGGWRHHVVAAKLKAEGVVRGVPDLHIPVRPPAIPHSPGVVIEMKAPDIAPKTLAADKWSGASPEQREWLAFYESAGWIALVCYGCDDALSSLADLGFPVPRPAAKWSPR